MDRTKILVTGAAGFIGSNLVQDLLKKGHSVVGLDNLSAGTRANVPDGCEFYQIDIRDPHAVERFANVHTVFHLAAKNCLADCAENPVETTDINVTGTTKVLEAAIQNKVNHFVYADTSAEYEGIDVFPSSIDHVHPLSIYASSKRGGALICQAFSHLHSLKTTTVRYFNVYGPAQDWRRVIPPVMSAFTLKLLNGEAPIIYGNGQKRRDFIHVDDVNQFHTQLLEDESLHGGTYNLGSGTDASIYEIYELIEAELKTGLRPIFQPDLPAEAERTLADIRETLQTGWVPQVPLKKGIQDFIQYTKNRLSEPEKDSATCPKELSPGQMAHRSC